MSGIFITVEELEATRGLPDLAVRVYWRMRSLMDFSTGIVGKHRRISYQALKEDCEVETAKGRGFMRTQPTEKALRCALSGLERHGLIEASGPLVFALPRAQKLQARPKQTGQIQGTLDIAASPYSVRDCGQTGQTETAEWGAPLRFKKSSIFVAAACRAPEPVDNSPGIAAAFLKKLASKTEYATASGAIESSAVSQLLNLPDETVLKATEQALAARQRDGSTAPLNAGFVARFVAPVADWRSTWSGIVGKGAALGVMPIDGEAAPYFKARVFRAAGERVTA